MSSPKLTFSLKGQLIKSTETDRQLVTDVNAVFGANKDLVFETILGASATATVNLQDMTAIEFLFIRTGGGGDLTATLTPQGGSPTAFKVNDILVMSGTKITAISLTSTVGCTVLLYAASL
jgi:hypothetical protein